MAGNVRLGKLPGGFNEVEIEEGDTVADVCQRAEMDIQGYEVRVNGETVNPSYVLHPDDRIIIVQEVKGN
jgi:sulfur carrier protein ThiS